MQLRIHNRGLPCEAEIAMANVNKRKEAEKKRKEQKCSSNVPTTRDMDNAEPPLKAKKPLNPRQDRQKAGAKASRSAGKKMSYICNYLETPNNRSSASLYHPPAGNLANM
jgi:hypothetical protein